MKSCISNVFFDYGDTHLTLFLRLRNFLNNLLWYCTILTPTELCLFFSSMHWIIKSGFADFDVGALSKFSTYYIPLPQQLASFAWYFHVVEGISQSQTLEYRFGRYLPVFFAHVHKILQSCLTANQIYSR